MTTLLERDALNSITERVIGCVHAVSNVLGVGFLEKVYENALVIALRGDGLAVSQQQGVDVRFRGQVVGHFVADLLVEGRVLVEIKAVRSVEDVHLAQCLNYLRATGLRVCLLVNFGVARAVVRRIVRDL